MTDNSVQAGCDAGWSNYSTACSDFNSAVSNSHNSHWGSDCSGTSQGASTGHSSSSTCSLPTTGFQTQTGNCAPLQTTGFQTQTGVCAPLQTTGFQSNVAYCGTLQVTGFHTQLEETCSLNITSFHVDLPSCGCEETTTTTTGCETGGSSSSSSCDTPTLTVSGSSIDTGMYTITGSSNDDGSLAITNDCTGKQITEVWGDPHVDDGTGVQVAEFQGNNLIIDLADGTQVMMEPTAITNGVAHLDNVTVTKGEDAVTMNGNNGTFQDGVTLSTVFAGAAAQNALFATGATVLSLNDNGNLYLNGANGAQGEQIVAANGTPMNLDGLGGAPSVNVA